MPPAVIEKEVARLLSARFDESTGIISSEPVSGGSINEAWKLETTAGSFFMKHNLADRYPSMFEKEAAGLKLLRDAGEIRIPEVIDSGQAGDHAFIILEFIESPPKTIGFWPGFGSALARLHKNYGESFGLDHDNFIGSLYQWNGRHPDWISFFIEERLERQVVMARDAGLIGSQLTSAFARLYKRLPDIFPVEPPSLIHGDLWSGNYMVDDQGQACIIDPAVYYGHREMDIGMSRLFGVFGGEFYDEYNREHPMEPGWRDRIGICNLYPLMVHVNLFGQGYVGSVQSVLMKF